MTKQNASTIGKLFKILKDVDLASNHDVSVWCCMRMCVEVDVTKPLLEGFTNKKANGILERIRFLYERLSDIFYMCRLIGHQIQVCPNVSQVVGEENRRKRQKYGPWMRADLFSAKPKQNPHPSEGGK